MRRSGEELRETISDATWIRLGQNMAACLGQAVEDPRRGRRPGMSFEVEDPDFTANQLYAQTLGTMQLARIGVGVRTTGGGIPEPFEIDAQRVQRACIDAVLASVGARRSR